MPGTVVTLDSLTTSFRMGVWPSRGSRYPWRLATETSHEINKAIHEAQSVKNPSASAGDLGSIPGSGRSPEEGNGNPLQSSCLENPLDRGDLARLHPWGHRSQTRLTDYSTSV